MAEAKQALAWALEIRPDQLPDPQPADLAGSGVKPRWSELFRHPRSLVVSWLGNLGAQTGVYGVTLWAPTLFVLILHISPA